MSEAAPQTALFSQPCFLSFPREWSMRDEEFWQMCARIEANESEEINVRDSGLLSAPRYETISVDGGEVAVIRLVGVMLKYAEPDSRYYVSMEYVSRQILAAAQDPAIAGIVLLIDSPGGQSKGIHTLEQAIVIARQSKKVIGYIEETCCSGAYWAGSQCDQLFASNPGTNVGSLGAFTTIADYSQMAERAGIKIHVERVGQWKGIGTPGAPVTEEQRAQIRTGLVAIADQFKAAVKRGRNFSEAQIEALFDGWHWLAGEAQQKGLIDGIKTLGEVVALAHVKKTAVKPTVTKTRIEKGTKMEPATFIELQAAFPSASPEFLVNQLKLGATLKTARENWDAEVSAKNAELTAKLTALETENAQLKAAAEKKVEEKKGPAKTGVTPVETRTVTGEESDSGMHPYLALAHTIQQAEKCSFKEAKLKAMKRDPEAHLSYIEATNPHQKKKFVEEVLGV